MPITVAARWKIGVFGANLSRSLNGGPLFICVCDVWRWSHCDGPIHISKKSSETFAVSGVNSELEHIKGWSLYKIKDVT
jgi:hypothetical protein